MSQAQFYLVTYDIACPRRWRRVFKALKAAGEHQQLSVFLCRLPPRRMAGLQARLAAVIDPAQDRLLVACLGTAAETAARLGSTTTPGILRSPAAIVL